MVSQAMVQVLEENLPRIELNQNLQYDLNMQTKTLHIFNDVTEDFKRSIDQLKPHMHGAHNTAVALDLAKRSGTRSIENLNHQHTGSRKTGEKPPAKDLDQVAALDLIKKQRRVSALLDNLLHEQKKFTQAEEERRRSKQMVDQKGLDPIYRRAQLISLLLGQTLCHQRKLADAESILRSSFAVPPRGSCWLEF
ncbi:hypothetical protein CCMA1212_010031 [Trichoderma ghanense]|uniref:Uncharacterized protein n=1 Tax=Trichoderma ghanense TaxID=65468 RepID=A0ABY2GQN2_9HYPO